MNDGRHKETSADNWDASDQSASGQCESERSTESTHNCLPFTNQHFIRSQMLTFLYFPKRTVHQCTKRHLPTAHAQPYGLLFTIIYLTAQPICLHNHFPPNYVTDWSSITVTYYSLAYISRFYQPRFSLYRLITTHISLIMNFAAYGLKLHCRTRIKKYRTWSNNEQWCTKCSTRTKNLKKRMRTSSVPQRIFETQQWRCELSFVNITYCSTQILVRKKRNFDRRTPNKISDQAKKYLSGSRK